ncbi:unnamed protein product [Cylicostephanus goldi]|uniref:Uncharacterized protein n=1 Tax=Cylicostephanus goldi TaxID=71465 RepID=A0A3P7PIZ0_CYLGO|nr:unnamed protein product [Cylicostephanus goldi]
MERTQYFPHILSRTAEDSRYKTLKSEIVININKADTSQAGCCPKLNEFTGFLNDDEWFASLQLLCFSMIDEALYI